MSTSTEALELLVVCEKCKAGLHEWCVTKSGNRSTYLHGARWQTTKEVRRLFWLDQEYEVKALCERALSPTADTEMVLRQALRNSDSMIASLNAQMKEGDD